MTRVYWNNYYWHFNSYFINSSWLSLHCLSSLSCYNWIWFFAPLFIVIVNAALVQTFFFFFSTRSAWQNTPFTFRLTQDKLSQTFAVGCTGGYWVHLPSVKMLMKIQVISGRKHAWLQRKGPVPLLPVTILLILHSEWNSSPGLPRSLANVCVLFRDCIPFF